MSGSAKAGTPAGRHTLRAVGSESLVHARSSVARVRGLFFLLTMTYMEVGNPDTTPAWLIPSECPVNWEQLCVAKVVRLFAVQSD